MTEVFADSFYYLALLNASDRFHAAAVAATQSLRSPLLTTSWILTEVADAMSAPAVRHRAHRLLQRIAADPNTRLIAASPEWYDRGLALYRARPDKSWSLTDCISFEVMKEHGIAEALTGDRHFIQAGFRPLLIEAGDSY